LESIKKQHTLDTPLPQKSDPAWNNLSAAAKHHCSDEVATQIESEIAQHLVNELDFNFVKMHLVNHVSDPIRQRGNLLNVSSELPDQEAMNFKQAYQQLTFHETTFQILRTKASQAMFL
jgi:hypothetical protein